jgi:hypothetical protein
MQYDVCSDRLFIPVHIHILYSVHCTVSPDMLFGALFSASNPKKLFWKRWPVLDWHWFLWISTHGKGESSPLFIITCHHHSHHLRGISPLCQLQIENKLFCSFAMVSSSCSKSCNGFDWIFFPFRFLDENLLFESRYWSVIVNMLILCLFLCLSRAYFDAYFESVTIWTYL